MILTLPAVLSPTELTDIRARLANAPWQAGRDSAGAQAYAIKNNAQLPHDSEVNRAIAQTVLKALDRHVLFFSAALPKRVFPPRVNRYAGDLNAFGAHIDNAIRVSPSNGQRLRTDLSCTVFLNEPSEYEGGELSIHGGGEVRRVKLKAGDAVLYPATTLHEVTPVTRGERLACFFWVESMVRSGEQRQILFDFDQTLQSLRATNDTAETIALTGHYHNLLRMWAEA